MKFFFAPADLGGQFQAPFVTSLFQLLPEIVDEIRFMTAIFAERFERLLTPFTKIRLKDRELSTDYSYCRRWVEGCGGEVWINTKHKIAHTGPFDYVGALDGGA